MLRRLLPLLCLAALLAPAAAGARTIRPLPDTWQKGMNIAAFRSTDFSGDRMYYWLKRLARHDHADAAMFVTRWIQYWRDPLRGDDLTSTDINPAFGTRAECRGRPRTDYTHCQTPSLKAEKRAIQFAQKLGMTVAIKPLIDVGRSPDSATGREWIDFSDPIQRRAWFDSYKYMLSQYARLARDVGADMLVIGTGLTKMTDEPAEQAEWRKIAEEVRSGDLMGDDKGGFTGKLTYAARWDSIYADVYDPGAHQFFWDALDYIGVEGFWPLIGAKDPGHDDPTISRLRQGWTFNFIKGGAPPASSLRSLHDEYQLPVILTGLGYLSRGGTAAAPSNGDGLQASRGGTFNLRAQQRPYHAAFDFWSGVAQQGDWFHGIYWWNWLPKIADDTNGDYTAQGKPAEVELCLRNLGHRSRKCRQSRMPR